MSRTDKTDPVGVQLARYAYEVHDHSTGVCTLPSRDSLPHGYKAFLRQVNRHSCYWTLPTAQWGKIFNRYEGEGEFVQRVRTRKARVNWRADED